MPSAAAASIRALQPREAAKPPDAQTPQVPSIPAIPVPDKPSLPLVNPATAQKESWISAQLNPANAAFIGNKYKPQIQEAGSELKANLQGYGAYDFTEGDLGVLSWKEREGTGESLGEQYRQETLRQLAAANARGMQSSRMADEAVGLAWSRLNQQKRDFFTRYATTTSSALTRLSTEWTGLTTDLLDLYGQDVTYAVENPILGPETSEAVAGAVTPGGGPAVPTKAGRVVWHGRVKPRMSSIAKKQAVPASQLQRKTRGGGKGYVVVRK